MSPILRRLLSELQPLYFKPNGFLKRKQRFARDVSTVMQEVEFQSSQWNSVDGPTRFYINVSIGFTDVPMADGKPVMSGTSRLSGLSAGARSEYDLIPESYDEVRDEILQSIPVALEALPSHYEDVRAYALRGSHCIIPIPESWR